MRSARSVPRLVKKNPSFCRIEFRTCFTAETCCVTLLRAYGTSATRAFFDHLLAVEFHTRRAELFQVAIKHGCEASCDGTSRENADAILRHAMKHPPRKSPATANRCGRCWTREGIEQRSNPNQPSFVIRKMQFLALRRLGIIKKYGDFSGRISTCKLACMLY